jgi:DNA-directed RNA polymerase subunit RPC12/RpoP
MSDGARDLLVRGVASARAGEDEQARKYFNWCLREDPDERQRVDAHYWLAKLSTNESEQREHLTRVLQLEPTHFAARRDLSVLDGELAADSLIDPNIDQPASAAEPAPIEQRRFICPQCGGRMTFDPGNYELTCSYCGHHAHLADALTQGSAVEESDFIQALVTAKGHLHPIATPTLECRACGASYLLNPGALSLSCAHCGSTIVVDRSASQDLIPPQGVVPFALDQKAAARKLRQWLSDGNIHPTDSVGGFRGVYLPAWTFDLTGEAPYHFERYDGDNWVAESGSQIVVYNDLPVPASHTLPPTFKECFFEFDLSALLEYDPSKLAGWPAETYQIPATDAAMAARWYVVDQARQKAQRSLSGRIRGFQLRSTDLLVAAYRLILLPFWLSGYAVRDAPYLAVINGQTGEVRAEQPANRILSALRRFLGW